MEEATETVEGSTGTGDNTKKQLRRGLIWFCLAILIWTLLNLTVALEESQGSIKHALLSLPWVIVNEIGYVLGSLAGVAFLFLIIPSITGLILLFFPKYRTWPSIVKNFMVWHKILIGFGILGLLLMLYTESARERMELKLGGRDFQETQSLILIDFV